MQLPLSVITYWYACACFANILIQNSMHRNNKRTWDILLDFMWKFLRSVFCDCFGIGKNCIVLKGTANSVSKAATEIGSKLSSATCSSAVSPKRRKENRHQRGTLNYWKHLLDENPVPGYWKFFQDGKSFFDILKSFFTSTEKHYEVDSKTFHAIRKLVEDTFNPEFVGLGADAKNLNHKRLRVKKVEIIENIDLFKNYNIKRCKMLGNSLGDKRGFPCKLEKIPRVEGIQNVIRKGGILTEKDISKRLMKDMIPELNEVYLFHGTKKDFVPNIISKGVDPKLGSDEGMFGRGVYCCESSTKADQYAGVCFIECLIIKNHTDFVNLYYDTRYWFKGVYLGYKN